MSEWEDTLAFSWILPLIIEGDGNEVNARV
jgi:hypothetical protein